MLPGLRHARDARLGVAPGLLGRVPHQGGDPKAELQRCEVATQGLLQPAEAVDARCDVLERLSPEQLHVGLGGGDAFGRLGSAAEVEAGVRTTGPPDRARAHRRAGDPVVLTLEGDVLLGPQAPHEAHELLRAPVSVGLVSLGVAVGREVVLTAHDVDEDPAAGEVVERRGRAREVRGLPVSGTDRDERLEARGAGGECCSDGEGVGPAPAGAEERPSPAVPFDRLGELDRVVEAPPALHGVVATVSGVDRVGDVPEELAAHAASMHGRPFNS